MIEVLYLGHIITQDRVWVDEKTIQDIQDWSMPTTLMHVRGFLGLCNYYRRLIRNFSHLATPLMQLTKKDAFVWGNEAQMAFEELKRVMCICPYLAILNFSIQFTIVYDPSKYGVGVILM